MGCTASLSQSEANVQGRNFHVSDPTMDRKTKLKCCLQPNNGKNLDCPTNSVQEFPGDLPPSISILAELERDATKLKHSHVAKKQQEKPLCLREGVEYSTRCDSSALLHWASEVLEKVKWKNPSKTSLWERGNSLWVCQGSVAGSEVRLLPNLPTPLL